MAGINAARRLAGVAGIVPPATTSLGSLIAYVTDRKRRDFQPMNANYGLFPAIQTKARGRDKRRVLAERAERDLGAWLAEHQMDGSGRCQTSA